MGMEASKGHAEKVVAEEDTETRQLLNSTQNPMEILLIIQEITSYLRIPDLKKVTSLNKQWCKESHKKMSNSKHCKPIEFNGRYHFINGKRPITRMVDLLWLISNNLKKRDGSFPVTKFEIDMSLLNTATDLAIMSKFLHVVAPMVKEITFNSTTKDNIQMESLRTAKKFEKLNYLGIKFCPDCECVEAAAKNNAIICFVGILHQSTGNLTSVSIKINEAGNEGMQLIINAMDSPKAPQIKRLKLVGCITDEHLMRLGGIGLQLQAFELSVCHGLRNSRNTIVQPNVSLMSFLEAQSDNLEEFALFGCMENVYEHPINLPRLPKLKRFWLDLNMKSYSQGVVFSGINYQQKFPNLNFLSIKPEKPQVWKPFLDTNMQPFEHLKSLEFTGPNYSRFEGDLSWIFHAARIFPNVKTLAIYARESVLQKVYTAFENVEQLTIYLYGQTSLTRILTGYSMEELNKMDKLPENMRPLPEFLHKLKVIKIMDGPSWRTDEDSHAAQPGITLVGETCRLVLMRLRSFQCLDLTECKNAKISKRMLKDMRVEKKIFVLCEKRNIIGEDTTKSRDNTESVELIDIE